jgi:hypothetical protein
MRITIAIGFLLAGCATQAEITSFRESYGDCVMDAVRRLDDGKTDPVSMAYGIAPRCAVQYAQLSQAMVSQNITERGQAAAQQRMRDNEIKLVTSAIVIFRAGKNHPH